MDENFKRIIIKDTKEALQDLEKWRGKLDQDFLVDQEKKLKKILRELER